MAAEQKKILYIEDEDEMVNLVRLILESRGYTMLTADNGADGIAIAERELPALVLLDLMMPEMDGWQVFQALRSNQALEATKIAIVTAKAQTIDRLLGLKIAKADDYITKPFSPEQLVDSVNRLIGQP